MTKNSLRSDGDTDFTMSVLKCDRCGKAFLQNLSLHGHKGQCHE